ncbi:hypothetical protein H0H87_011485, partial [Tephrocybe sp. NHM501043]
DKLFGHTQEVRGPSLKESHQLLNPTGEKTVYDEGTEDDIFKAVMEHHKTIQWREKNEGDISEDDVDDEPKPTHREALLAVSTLQKYISDIDDPFTQKFEVILGAFGHQTRINAAQSLKNTSITSYFTQ